MLIVAQIWTDYARRPELGWMRLSGGQIESMGHGPPPTGSRPDASTNADTAGETLEAPDAVLLPAFTDAHAHLPQFGERGRIAPDLLTWLDEAIFPAEARWSDPAHAEAEATACLRAMRRAGTARAAVYLSSHPWAWDAARAAADATGVDLLAGVSLMDRACPDDLRQPDAPAPPDAGGPRLRWSINPRFAISCTDDLLGVAGELGADRFVQTHLSEQVAEVERTAELFPGDADYTSVYDRFGLLHERTLLAHCIHLAPAEWQRIAARDCVVVHCPGANTFLESGHFDFAAARRAGVRVALGSDIAAGPDVAMPRVARAMLDVARTRRMTGDSGAHVPSAAEVWRMITADGASAVGRPDAGILQPGATADLLLLEPDQRIDDHLAGRMLHAWDDGWIRHRILDGTLVSD
ncbi:MAG: amidohydrolase family protein [Phycisphaerales bacterium]